MEIYYAFISEGENQRDASRLLLKKVLFEHGYDISKLTGGVGVYGKPFYRELNFDFNISHTAGMVAVCTGKRVGVDCEKIKPVLLKVIQRVCGSDEVEKILTSKNPEKEFMMSWTLKEAFSKMLGSAFRYSFKAIEPNIILNNFSNIKIYQVELFGYVLTAVDQAGGEIQIEEIDLLS